jgi:hypothetical protein
LESGELFRPNLLLPHLGEVLLKPFLGLVALVGCLTLLLEV